jgi:hypothetical protein
MGYEYSSTHKAPVFKIIFYSRVGKGVISYQ